MKKLGIALLAAAFSLPLTFAAQTQSAPSDQQTQTGTAKSHKKGTKNSKKRHHSKKAKTSNSSAPAATK